MLLSTLDYATFITTIFVWQVLWFFLFFIKFALLLMTENALVNEEETILPLQSRNG